MRSLFQIRIQGLRQRLKLKGMFSNTRYSYLVLALILLIAFLLRVENLRYNSLFIDEATYIVRGKRILDGYIAEVIGDIAWIGGFPFFYPLLSALFYILGGIWATRFFSVLLGTGTVLATYVFTRELGFFRKTNSNVLAGILAALFMATSAIPITESRLAVYDMLTYSLFLTSLIVLRRAGRTRSPSVYFSAAFLFFLSFLAKYVVIMYLPIFLLLPSVYAALRGKRLALKQVVEYAVGPLALMMTFYIGLNSTRLYEFLTQQTITQEASVRVVINNFFESNWVLMILALFGVSLLLRKQLWVALILVSAMFLPLLSHMVSGNALSVSQHSFLSLIFAIPLIGGFLTLLLQRSRFMGLSLLCISLLANIIAGRHQITHAGTFWPNSRDAVEYLAKNVKPGDKLFVESGDTVTLELYDRIPVDDIVGPFSFSYSDKQGLAAYLAAIEDGYFRFVEFEQTYISQEDLGRFENALQSGYNKVFDDGEIRIYERL